MCWGLVDSHSWLQGRTPRKDGMPKRPDSVRQSLSIEAAARRHQLRRSVPRRSANPPPSPAFRHEAGRMKLVTCEPRRHSAAHPRDLQRSDRELHGVVRLRAAHRRGHGRLVRRQGREELPGHRRRERSRRTAGLRQLRPVSRAAGLQIHRRAFRLRRHALPRPGCRARVARGHHRGRGAPATITCWSAASTPPNAVSIRLHERLASPTAATVKQSRFQVRPLAGSGALSAHTRDAGRAGDG